jgi:hypothetical protein
MPDMMMRTVTLAGIVVAAFAQNAAANIGPGCPPARSAAGTASPRTPWGDPDLQGVWSGIALIGVPLDRDPALGTRNVLTEAEFQARRARMVAGATLDNIEATNFGAEPEFVAAASRQASLVVDPPDGRRPSRTPGAEARRPPPNSFTSGPFDSVLDLGTYDRCIAYSTVPAALPINGLQIVQGPGYVAIRAEYIHEARVIPLKRRPHVGESIATFAGDSRGRWDGPTLVVETTNLNGQTNLTGNGGGRPTSQARIIERFTLTDRETLAYEATVDDPGTWTRPWTVAFSRARDESYHLYEVACHEGNYGVANILRAARAADAAGR